MALGSKTITQREIAVLYYHVFSGCEDWRLLYQLADNTDGTNQPNKTAVSLWKHSDKVKNALVDIRQKFALITAQYEQRGADKEKEKKVNQGGNEHTKTSGQKAVLRVDYTNPKNQADKLNELINTADDPGEALDALKVIIQSQRADRESAKEGKQTRVYIPINCADCPLYQDIKTKNLK